MTRGRGGSGLSEGDQIITLGNLLRSGIFDHTASDDSAGETSP